MEGLFWGISSETLSEEVKSIWSKKSWVIKFKALLGLHSDAADKLDPDPDDESEDEDEEPTELRTNRKWLLIALVEMIALQTIFIKKMRNNKSFWSEIKKGFQRIRDSK